MAVKKVTFLSAAEPLSAMIVTAPSGDQYVVFPLRDGTPVGFPVGYANFLVEFVREATTRPEGVSLH